MTTAETVPGASITPRQDPLRIAAAAARNLLAGAAAFYLVVYLALALVRLNCPYELEWMEGACVDHVQRILAGRTLYAEPSVEFTPFCYTPLYFYVSAAASRLLGPGLLPLRLVSIAASAGVLALLLQFVRRLTGSAMWGLVSAGLFAATYRLTGAWFDIARIDSLFLLLLLAAIYLVYFGDGAGPLLLAGVLASLAFLTKQTALLAVVPLIAYVFLARRLRAALAFAVTFAAILLVSTAVLNITSGGWYSYYVFHVPLFHDTLPGMWTAFWRTDLAAPLGIAMAVSIFCMGGGLAMDLRRHFAFFVALLVGLVSTSWLGRVHGAGYDNVLQPACLFLAIGFGPGLRMLESYWRGHDAAGRATATGPLPGPRRLEPALLLSLYGVALVQFALLIYSPSQQIPTARDGLAGDDVVRTIKGLKGPVWVPYHGYLATMAGHPAFAHAMAINDVLRGPEGPGKEAMLADIRRAVASRRFGAILLDEGEPWLFAKGTPGYAEFIANYDPRELVIKDKDAFWPVTGLRTRPMLLCVARPGPAQSQPAAQAQPAGT